MPYPTLTNLVTQLSYRLHDSSNGQWPVAELEQYLNSGRRRTIFETKCHTETVSVAMVADTHTYDCEPLFEILGVRVGRLLEKRALASMELNSEMWDVRESSARPSVWMPITGSQIRIWKPPASTTLGQAETVATDPVAGGTGYAVDDTLYVDNADGNAAIVKVAAQSGGVVSTVELYSDESGTFTLGTNYQSTGTKTTTAISPATGTGCTVNLTGLTTHLKAYGVANVDDMANGMITTLNSTPTAGGTGYTLNDILTITTGGTGGQCRVTAVSGGVVTAVSLISAGKDYTAASGKATVGGTGGADCTVNITAVADGRQWAITEIPLAYAEDAMLYAAEEEARSARPNMPGSLERAKVCRALWFEVCERIKESLKS